VWAKIENLSKIEKLDKNIFHASKNRKFEQNQKNLWKIFFMWAKIENLSKIKKTCGKYFSCGQKSKI
jgi:hypothetical protein